MRPKLNENNMKRIVITPPSKVRADITLPSSKSICNRALVINALAGGKTRIENLSDCDDTRVMVRALSEMPDTIDIGAAGTAMRFLTAYLSVNEGTRTLTGTERMLQRPIGILAEALRTMGADVEYIGRDESSEKVLARDTFRAAAGEQLKEWANRAGVDIISQSEGADPAAVVYDAVAAAKARDVDILLCDTAGRLHNKKNLMNELSKINRIIQKEYSEAYLETLIVLDGTTGQNALAQAKQFKEATDISGIILTKLDGTAKGGIAIAIQSELGIPVKYIGIGEQIDDLQEFDSDMFVNALFERGDE